MDTAQTVKVSAGQDAGFRRVKAHRRETHIRLRENVAFRPFFVQRPDHDGGLVFRAPVSVVPRLVAVR